MDSLDWSRKFTVLSISRLDLNSLGIHPDQVSTLTDADMDRIADILIAHHFDHEFEEEVLFTARLVLAEKQQGTHQAHDVTVTIGSLGKPLQMPTERVEGSYEDAEHWIEQAYKGCTIVDAVIEPRGGQENETGIGTIPD